MNSRIEPSDLIRILELRPLPMEGGMTCQTYISNRQVEGEPLGTAIYYLLQEDTFSHLHLLTGDEMYHFYLGDPVELTMLNPDGSSRTVVLGQDLRNGQRLQQLVPAGVWQGSHLASGGRWALLGTTMWPGYTQACYTHGSREELTRRYPAAKEQIEKLTTELT